MIPPIGIKLNINIINESAIDSGKFIMLNIINERIVLVTAINI